MKRKIITVCASGHGIVHQTCKKLLKLSNQKASISIKKGAKDLNRHFIKDLPVVNKHMRSCKTSLVRREMKITTKTR